MCTIKQKRRNKIRGLWLWLVCCSLLPSCYFHHPFTFTYKTLLFEFEFHWAQWRAKNSWPMTYLTFVCWSLLYIVHGAWLYGVHRMHQDGSSFKLHQPCNSQTALPLRWIFKNMLWKALQCSESAQERRIALYKSDLQYSTILRSWADSLYSHFCHTFWTCSKHH